MVLCGKFIKLLHVKFFVSLAGVFVFLQVPILGTLDKQGTNVVRRRRGASSHASFRTTSPENQRRTRMMIRAGPQTTGTRD